MTLQAKLHAWRLPLTWAAMLLLSFAVQTGTLVIDSARIGAPISWTMAAVLEGSSHLTLFLLIPFVYGMHRHWPLRAGWRNLALHAGATVPFCLAHMAGMALLRWLLLDLALRTDYIYTLSAGQLAYEYGKDVITYATFSAAIAALDHFYGGPPIPADPPAPPSTSAQAQRPERFAVRKRGREVLVRIAEISRIEAAGNYAILHAGVERHEIRATLASLEAELDPSRFVRVHKSHIVNLETVREIEPGAGGDAILRLGDGGSVPLSRRYRERFASFVPLRR